MRTSQEILAEVKELLRDKSRWTQYVYARNAKAVRVSPRDKSAVCWCLMGAVDKSVDNQKETNAVMAALMAAQGPGRPRKELAHINDSEGYEEVMALLEKATA